MEIKSGRAGRLSVLIFFPVMLLMVLPALAIAQTTPATPVPATSPAPIDSQRRADIIKLLQITGAGDIGAKVLNQIICSFRQAKPTVPEKFWQDFRDSVNQDSLLELCIPIYDKALTDNEIKKMIKFFESRIGKKFIDILPHVTEQSMMKGEEWGQEISARIAKKLDEQGYGKPKAKTIKSPKSPAGPKPPTQPLPSKKDGN
jgi:uncharacterized protein